MTMSCEPSLLFRQQVCIWQLRSFLETVIFRSGACPSRLCVPGRACWSTRRPWPSTPSSCTPSGCPSLLLSLDHLVASLHQASRGHSRSRILEISYLDMVVLWTGRGNTQIVQVNIIIFRFDCQFLMATFVNVYIHSFINLPTPGKIIQQVYLLLPEEQLELFKELETSLLQRGILQPWALLGFLLLSLTPDQLLS